MSGYDDEFGGDYARDTHRGGLGDDYARDRGWSGGGRHDQYAREGEPAASRPTGDARIAEQIHERLTDDQHVDATNIAVRVADSVVHLAGRVRSRAEKRRAEDIAFSCAGVHDVMNELRISASDEEVAIGKASE